MVWRLALKKSPGAEYRIQEFATLAGVSARALQYYDRIGLLRPAGRSDAGYRLYRNSNFAQLEQIVVLKFLGLPLKQIGRLVRRESSLKDALRRQQDVLAEKRRQLGCAIDAIRKAERSIERSGEPDWELFKKIVKEIEMQNDTGWSKKYYSPEAKAKIEEGRQRWSPELQADVSRKWAALYADVEQAIADGESPSGARAQALAARWKTLVAGFTGGDPEIQTGLNKMWSDEANWPAPQKQAYAINPEIQDFIVRAMKAK
jgi:MerR family transcriptional regulator, thiopeptide resistance regulator